MPSQKFEVENNTITTFREFFSKIGLRPLAFLVVDLDHFKKVNEQAGHDGADKVLLAVTQTIQKCLDSKGTAYRYGGDEFVALLPNFELEEAKPIADRIRRDIESLKHSTPGVKSTVTTGISAYPDPVCLPEELFSTADSFFWTPRKMAKGTCA